MGTQPDGQPTAAPQPRGVADAREFDEGWAAQAPAAAPAAAPPSSPPSVVAAPPRPAGPPGAQPSSSPEAPEPELDDETKRLILEADQIGQRVALQLSEKPPAPEPIEPKPAAPAPPAPPAPPAADTGRIVADALAFRAELPKDAKVPGIEDPVDLNETRETYGEIMAAARIETAQLFQHAAQRLLGEVTERVKAVLKDYDQSSRDPEDVKVVKAELAELRFWQPILAAHPDAQQIAESPEFKAWLPKQSPFVQKAAAQGGPEGGIKVLSAYKSQRANAAKAQEQHATAAERRIGLVQDGAPTRRAAATSTSGVDMDDFDAGWSEALKSQN